MLGIGSALMCAPQLLLVDELSLGLAPLVVRELMQRLRAVREQLGTALLWWSRTRRSPSTSRTTPT